MKLIEISPSDSKIWSEVWDVYISSFPDYERRGVISHKSASENDAFNTTIAIDEAGNFLALLFYWRCKELIYIEHLAVNPQNRGANIGTKIMKAFIQENKDCTVVLEIEPPISDITKRRLSFYKRLGFCENKYEYTHPSYAKVHFIHRLDILSYHKELSQLEYENFCEFISKVILSYIE